jgi:membrane-associated protein
MKKTEGLRHILFGLAVVRVVIGVAAIPLAPFLYKEHFMWLVFMRPTKEVLLAGGFLVRLGKVWWVPIVAAAVPLAIFGVWQFYYLGRQYADRIKSGNLPWIMDRVLRPKHVKPMQKLLRRKGMKLVLLGRLAVFPSSVVALAAGSGDIPSRRFLPSDAAGGLLSIVEVMGAGFLLGQAYKSAGPWITVVGVAVALVLAFIVGRGLRREVKKTKSPRRRPAARKRQAARSTSRS